MAVKFKVNLPITSITTDKIPVEVELDEQALGGALAMLVQQKTGVDDVTTASLRTDAAGNVFIVDSSGDVLETKVKESPSVAALVDAMNVLLFKEPKRLGEGK
ncbi:MAG: hypothetical protein JWP00_1142 [Chloroflexi bacterium]|jgi:hypothetical protein|nr:hypothetical protein [Chloroflexota bacterium]